MQFIRFHSQALNIHKKSIELYEISAGARAVLWLGLDDEMSNPESTDLIERESTRVKGVICTETQASYDMPN